MSITITDKGTHIKVDLGYNQDIMMFPKSDTTVWSESADGKVYLQTTRTSYGIAYSDVGTPVLSSQSELFTYLQNIALGGGVNTDAFGAARTSEPANRLDVECIYDTQEEIMDKVLGGNGTITHNATTGDVTLATVANGVGDYAYLQSHPVPYTAGNSQKIDITGALDLAAIRTSGTDAAVLCAAKWNEIR